MGKTIIKIGKIVGLGFVVACCLLFCSCSTPVISEFAMDKMITVNGDGVPCLFPLKKQNKVIDPEEYTFKDQLDAIEKGINKSGRKKILIFVCGGMNSLEYNVERAEKLTREIYEKSDFYPICINWQTSLFNCYFEHLLFIRKGYKTYTLGPPLAPFYFIMDIGRALLYLPVGLVYQSYGTFYGNFEEVETTMEIEKALKNLKIRYFLGKDHTPTSIRVIRQINYIAGFPIRPLTSLLIDTFAKSSWDIMKRRSRTIFEQVQHFEAVDEKVVLNALSPCDGAMSQLMDRLSVMSKNDNEIEFTLIGHSLGPAIINELLMRYNKLPYKDIVYMAAACSAKETAEAVVPYLRHHPDSTFYNLCVHPNIDSQDMMIYGVLPKGSVLEWINLFFSHPITPSDHAVGEWLTAAENLPKLTRGVQKQVVIKGFGVGDPRTNDIILNMPEQHTDFSNPELLFWEKRFWEIPEADKK